MRVQFIYPNTVQHPKDISVGIAILAAVLKRGGHEVELIDTTFGMTDGEILSRVKRFDPGLVALSAMTANFPYAAHVAGLIKDRFKLPTIIGGVHPTVAPEEAICKDGFDMVCISEGEEALLELTDSMENGDKNTTINNIWFKENGEVIKNGLRPLVKDLDSLPYADTDIYDYPRYLNSHNMVATFLSGRGCPHQCSYCINHTAIKLYKGLGPFVRYRSVDNVLQEIKGVVNKYDIKRVELLDDTFTLKKARVKEFCKAFKETIGLPFHCNARVDNLTDEVCSDLARGGCRRISIGLESGDERLRKEVLNKNITNEQIIEGCRLIKKHGMELYTYNMIGIPTEKKKNIRNTIRLNRKVRPDYMAVAIFTAYKGTGLYELCKKKGWLGEETAEGSYYSNTNTRYPHLSVRRLRRIRGWFGFWVFITYDPVRAFMELVDRNLVHYRFYSRIRSFMITRIHRYGEASGAVK